MLELYKENYKILLQAIKEGIRILCSWIERFNTLKISICPKLTYNFNEIPIKIPKGYFSET